MVRTPLLLLVLLAACAGEVNHSDGLVTTDGPPPHDGQVAEQHATDGKTTPTETAPPPGPCDPYEEAATHSCAGGQGCPHGLQPPAPGSP